MSKWSEAQTWESKWWDTCQNTLGEEQKQLVYANRMGLNFFHDGRSPYNIDMRGAKVLDVGGGPVSLLLKCVNVAGKVVDPLLVPTWISERYIHAGIKYEPKSGEKMQEEGYDEAWIYNVLQHTSNPSLVIKKAKAAANLVRLFEWIDTPQNIGHPHTLRAATLDQWLGGQGKVETLKEPQLQGRCYYGVFLGDSYGQ